MALFQSSVLGYLLAQSSASSCGVLVSFWPWSKSLMSPDFMKTTGKRTKSPASVESCSPQGQNGCSPQVRAPHRGWKSRLRLRNQSACGPINVALICTGGLLLGLCEAACNCGMDRSKKKHMNVNLNVRGTCVMEHSTRCSLLLHLERRL